MLPQVFWAGAEKTEVSKYCLPGPMSPNTFGVAVQVRAAAVARARAGVAPAARMSMGVPD